MFTPARIVAALDAALKGAAISMVAAHAPAWAIILVASASLFTGALVAVSDPVHRPAPPPPSSPSDAIAALQRAAKRDS